MLQAQEQVAVGQPSAHSKCHVHMFEDDLVVDTRCWLEQYGAEQGFVHCDEPSTFKVQVTLEGRLVEHLCFDLCIAVHTECYGPQDPAPLKPQSVSHEPHGPGDDSDYRYTLEWDIPAGYFCPPDGEDCGQVCCFAVAVTSRSKAGRPGHVGCVCRGPCVMIHKKPT